MSRVGAACGDGTRVEPVGLRATAYPPPLASKVATYGQPRRETRGRTQSQDRGPFVNHEVALDDLAAPETVDARIAELGEIKRGLVE